MNTILIDIMTCGGAKFYGTLRYEYNPLFKLDIAEIFTWVLERRPILKYEREISGCSLTTQLQAKRCQFNFF